MKEQNKPTREDQHPGTPHCSSCIEDEEYDPTYSMYPACCCRSLLSFAELDALEESDSPVPLPKVGE